MPHGMEKMKGKVFVGMSGGVDSSVAAALLKKEGYNVVGVFIKVWEPGGYVCTWRDDRRDAMRVAALLEIPFITLDLEEEYKQGVVDYMIREYQLGRTPNPDVMCNKEVKFGAFYKKAREMGADFVATGHYAQVEDGKLLESNDKAKDQTYFLWTLPLETLEHTLFPIGGFKKDEVRKLAKKFKLPNALKKDSQGLCFIGKFDVKEFLKRYIKEKTGNVINETGKIVGNHDGVFFYTIGERHGFSVEQMGPENKPFYVVGKNIEKNELVVSNKSPEDRANVLSLKLESVNWNQGDILASDREYTCQYRYHGEKIACTIKNDASNIVVTFKESQATIATGQSVVFYDGSVCLGGGIIAS